MNEKSLDSRNLFNNEKIKVKLGCHNFLVFRKIVPERAKLLHCEFDFPWWIPSLKSLNVCEKKRSPFGKSILSKNCTNEKRRLI